MTLAQLRTAHSILFTDEGDRRLDVDPEADVSFDTAPGDPTVAVLHVKGRGGWQRYVIDTDGRVVAS